MRRILEITPQRKTTLIRDNHVEGRYYVHTEHNDDAALELNKRLRLEGISPAGGKLGVHDGAKVLAHFQVPSLALWQRFCKDYPGVLAQLHSTDESQRIRAAQMILRLHPEWSTAPANR